MTAWQRLKKVILGDETSYDGPRPDLLLPAQVPGARTGAQADAAFVALQAKKLEEAINLTDTGAMSRRRAADSSDRVPSRQAVLDADERLRAQRVERLLWVLRAECSPSGSGCRHSTDYHRPAAEAGVAALFPKGAFAS